jgi:hypothetical protein
LNKFLYNKVDDKDLKNVYYSLNSTYAERKEKRLKEIAEKWPEWYNRVIVNGEKSTYSIVKKDLYNWWLRKCRDGTEIKVGHRYYCALALVSFATKCNVPYEEVKADLYSCLDIFDKKTFQDENHFLPEDIEDALKLYGKPIAHRFKREYISKQTSIEIKKNKRNGLPRKKHLEIARFTKKIRRETMGIKNYKTTPFKKDILEAITREIQNHPEYTTKDLSLSLNLSIGTVSKYYQKIKENLNMNKKELIIYNQMKNFPEASKSELSVITNISLPTIIKYYDKIKEIVDRELAFESIFEEEDNE